MGVSSRRPWAVLLGMIAVGWGGPTSRASAQGIEALGTRALGMGGAFVAVADDASAVYWNPAGLPRSSLVNATVEHQVHETGPETDSGEPIADLQGGSATFTALAVPAVAFSYYRLRTTRLIVPDGGSPLEQPAGLPPPPTTTSLVTHNVGGTFVQSIGEYLDVATTIRYVRGVASFGPRDPALASDDALERAADLPGRGSSTVDLDLGALLVVGRVRAGVLVRNLREPSFETGGLGANPDVDSGISLSLDRQVRVGAAWQSTPASIGPSTTLACDVDLTESESARGPRRHVAIGGEQWWGARRLGVRAGLRLNTVDDAEPVGSAGVSARLTSSLFVETQITRGASERDRSWGVALRFAY